MPKSFQKLVLSIFLLSMFGCASERNLIVLMPDDNGDVGQIIVSNSAGSQTVSQAEHGVVVPNASSKPKKPKLIEKEKISDIFGSALAAQPLPPTRFLLYFKSDSTQLTSKSRKLIPEIVNTISERDSSDISIVGHTDTQGAKDYNMGLSNKRAKAIANLLASKGVDTTSFEVTSHGEGNPLIKTADNVSEPRNRRVEVTVR